MRSLVLCAALALALVAAQLGHPRPAHAIADPGTIAPEFVKNEVVNGAAGPAWSLGAHAGKVIILFMMGYS